MHKTITFETTLRLRKPVLAEDCLDCRPGATTEYRLVATVSHHGRNMNGGGGGGGGEGGLRPRATGEGL